MRYVTGKKELILKLLSQGCDTSYSIEEICGKITNNGNGKSTVYRLVSELVDAGAVRRLSDSKTRRVTYQYIGGDSCHGHMHLKCNGCGKLIHLDEKMSHKLAASVRNAGGFVLDEGAFLFGRCLKCAEVKS